LFVFVFCSQCCPFVIVLFVVVRRRRQTIQ
jgi:hypothetical protein